MSTQPCPDCGGARLRVEARHVFVDERTLPEITDMPVGESAEYFKQLTFTGGKADIADKILKELRDRFRFLVDVGLNYLTLSRSADSLSGGEAQRIRLASQIGAGLVGVMYILDEPSIGLHQRDNERLLRTLIHLRDIGNTVIVVEHDEDAIRRADHIIDIGPGAGVHGGESIAQGDIEAIMAAEESITGQYPSGRREIATPDPRLPVDPARILRLTGARGNSPQNATLERAPRDCPAGSSIAGGPRKDTAANRRAWQQPAECYSRTARRFDDLHHGRLRLGQVHFNQCHPIPTGGHRAQRRHHLKSRALRSCGRDVAVRQVCGYRPKPHRAHPPLKPRHLHRYFYAYPRAVCWHSGSALAGLQTRPVQL